jgi:hypothetical protein
MTIMMEDNKKRKQRGVALLIVIFALLLVTGIALAMMAMSDTETSISANYRDSQKAYFSALAGIQEARVRILTENTPVITGGSGGVLPNGGTSGMPATTNATGVVYILNSNGSDTIEPWTTTNNFFDDELCHEYYPGLTNIFDTADTGASSNVPCTKSPAANNWYTTKTSTDPNTGTNAALDYNWVRISLKENRSSWPYLVAANNSTNNNVPICWDGLKQIPMPAGMTSCTDHSLGFYYESVYRVASLARTKIGTRRMVVAEVANTPPLVTNAAVDSQDHVTLNGQLNVNGFDACSCNLGNFGGSGYDMSACTATTTGSGSNRVTTYSNCPNRAPYTCDTTKYAIYAAGTVDNPNSSETIVAGTTPAIAQSQPWNYDIAGLINTYKAGAVPVTGSPYGYSCTANTYDSSGNLTANGSCGTHSSQTFGVPPPFPPTYDSTGALTWPSGTNPAPTSQVTYVPGNLQITAGSVGNGILIVDGDLDIHGGLQFYGLILVRGVVKFTGGGSDATNIFGAVLAGQESYVDNTLGGSASINFSSCALKQNQTPQPPRLISIREATY